MLDSEIVAAIIVGDPDGLAAAYDRYAAPLYAFCQSLLYDQADAADVVQETFVIASGKLERLRDPDLLKPWLFAVARNECHHRLRARPGVAGTEDGEAVDDTIDLGIDLERAEPGEVAVAAMAALPPAKREITELSLHQDFDRDDLASTLGVSRSQAKGLASRTRRQFEKSVAAMLAVRSGGRRYCDELDELLDIQGGMLTAAGCQEIVRHVQHCRTCSKRRRRDLQPGALLGALPATEIARGLRGQVLGVVASDAPDVVAYRADVVWEAMPLDEATGFPVPVDRPHRERRVRPAVLALGATAAFAALGAVGLELALHHPHHHQQQQLAAAPVGGRLSPPSQVPGTSSSPSQAPGRHSPTPGTPGSLAAATPGSTPTTSPLSTGPAGTTTRPLGSNSPSGPGSTSPSSPSSPPPSTPSTPAPGGLTESPASVGLVLSPGGASASGSFTLTANGSGMTYSISVPAAYAGALAVSPSSGSLGPGASVTISVIWNSTAALTTSLTVDPGGKGVFVSYQPPAASPNPSVPSVPGVVHGAEDLLHGV